MGTSRSNRSVGEITPDPTAEEAAAVVAAIEQFLRDMAVLADATPGKPGVLRPWKRAGLAEGVTRRPGSPAPWA
jgi:hypothetical protein